MSRLAFKILPNRDLEISLVGKLDEDEIASLLKKGANNALYDLFEYEHCNGGPHVTDAETLYKDGYQHLTDAPFIVSGWTIPDSGHESFWGSAWWFPNYMVVNEVEVLLREGKVKFEFGHEIGKPVDCDDCRVKGHPTGISADDEDCSSCRGRGFTLVLYADEAEWFRIEREMMGAA